MKQTKIQRQTENQTQVLYNTNLRDGVHIGYQFMDGWFRHSSTKGHGIWDILGAPDRHMAAGFPVAQMPHSDVTAQPPIQQPVWA